jgi:uncharacterized membrane protein
MSVGLLTDPRSLAEYEQAVPGAGKAILDKFFEQTTREIEHRHAIEREAMEQEREHGQALLKQGDRGQWLGLTVALAGFALVGYVSYLGHPVTAAVIGSLDILGLVSVFIYGRHKQAEELLAEKQLEQTSTPPQPTSTSPTQE